MRKIRSVDGHVIIIVVLAMVWLAASVACAETIELVTYYPTAPTQDILHVNRLTVGSQYNAEQPADGQAFIYDRVGIGPGFTAADPPSQRLEVVGNVLANAGGTALFMASRGDNVSYYNGLQLLTNSVVQWTIGSRPGSEHLQVYSDADSAVRLFIQQGTGNIGIGTTTPTGRLHVVGTDDAVSNVLFMPGADTVANPAIPQIRVGIGPGFTIANPPASTLQVEGSLGMAVTVVAGSVALNETHNIVLCNNGGAMTVGLPPAAQNAGRTYYIKKVSNNVAEVVIDPNGAEGIDGQLTLSLYVRNDAVRIVSDGANWNVISDEIRPHTAKMTREAPQLIPGWAQTGIDFDTEVFDIGDLANIGTDRITIRRTGRYLVTAIYTTGLSPRWEAELQVWLNGVAICAPRIGNATVSNTTLSVQWSDVLALNAGDFLQLKVEQYSKNAAETVNIAWNGFAGMTITEIRP